MPPKIINDLRKASKRTVLKPKPVLGAGKKPAVPDEEPKAATSVAASATPAIRPEPAGKTVKAFFQAPLTH